MIKPTSHIKNGTPSFICANFNPCHQRILHIMLGWNRPLEKCGPRLEETWIPFTRGCFSFSWFNLAQWFCRRRILDVVNVVSLSLLSPGKMRGHSLKKTNTINILYSTIKCANSGLSAITYSRFQVLKKFDISGRRLLLHRISAIWRSSGSDSLPLCFG